MQEGDLPTSLFFLPRVPCCLAHPAFICVHPCSSVAIPYSRSIISVCSRVNWPVYSSKYRPRR